MRDLTQGSITRHLLGMAAFIGIGLIVQTLYLLIDLYFVSRLGPVAVAGVSTAGVSTFIGMAVSQLIAVGALSLIAQAIGRKDDADAQLVFDQALSLSLVTALFTLVIGYTLGVIGVRALGADPATSRQAEIYLMAFLPSLACMFPMSAIGSALRASGVVGPPMMIQSMTVLVNALLAPILIAGWGTGYPLGVAGAGLASSIATSIGILVLGLRFNHFQKHLVLHLPSLAPRFPVWRRIVAIGFPSAGEFMLMFIINGVVFAIIRDFGSDAQAAFGIGGRISQSIFLPAMAVAFAAAPIAGQNFGARRGDRVIGTFARSATISSAIMVTLTLLCQIKPEILIYPFTRNPNVVAIGAEYLHISSWNFLAIGLIFSCSGMFQALGNTRPVLLSSGSRLLTFVLPALWLAHRPGVQLHDFWHLSVASVLLQAVISLILIRHQLGRKLAFEPQATAMPSGA